MPKATDTDIPIAFLHECFDLDIETGVLTWRTRPREHFHTAAEVQGAWNTRNAGKVAGRPHPNGYTRIAVRIAGAQRYLYAHRIIWALTTGDWPADQIDHRNGISKQSRIGNLREATHSENQHNRKMNRRNTSGFPGVCLFKRTGKWIAQIMANRQHHYLGYFDTPEAAFAAYLAAKAIYHPTQPTPRETQRVS